MAPTLAELLGPEAVWRALECARRTRASIIEIAVAGIEGMQMQHGLPPFAYEPIVQPDVIVHHEEGRCP